MYLTDPKFLLHQYIHMYLSSRLWSFIYIVLKDRALPIWYAISSPYQMIVWTIIDQLIHFCDTLNIRQWVFSIIILYKPGWQQKYSAFYKTIFISYIDLSSLSVLFYYYYVQRRNYRAVRVGRFLIRFCSF